MAEEARVFVRNVHGFKGERTYSRRSQPYALCANSHGVQSHVARQRVVLVCRLCRTGPNQWFRQHSLLISDLMLQLLQWPTTRAGCSSPSVREGVHVTEAHAMPQRGPRERSSHFQVFLKFANKVAKTHSCSCGLCKDGTFCECSSVPERKC